LRKSLSGTVLSLLWLAACGGGTSSPSPGTPPNQASSNLAVVRSSAGVSPTASAVSGTGSLTIVNSDGASHPLASNAYPHQLDCPELSSPMSAPGDQFRAAIANRNRTCALIDILILLTRASRAHKVMTDGRNPSGDGTGGSGTGY
jgi:hypothetical protein